MSDHSNDDAHIDRQQVERDLADLRVTTGESVKPAGVAVAGGTGDDVLDPADMMARPDENLDASQGVGKAGTGDGGLGEGRSFAHDAGGGVGVGQSDEERLTELVEEDLRKGPGTPSTSTV